MPERIEFRLENTVGMPMWVINNYISHLCEHCMKLYLLFKINDSMSKNRRVICLRKSIPVNRNEEYIKELININKEEILNYSNAYDSNIKIKHNEYCVLSYDDLDSFKMFLKLKRPMCFTIDSQNGINYFYESSEKDVMKITDFKYHSPVELILSSALIVIEVIKIIIELRMEYQKYKRKEKREKEEHILIMEKLMLEKEVFEGKKDVVDIIKKYLDEIGNDFNEMGLEKVH